MTIRDMETITGLTRANIRFYEAQGLIAPERKENNYREYSEYDSEVLLRIKLLRALGMTIEQIRGIQAGSENLVAALDRQIGILARQQEQLGHSQRVCCQMRQDNVDYTTLDARRYLNSLEHPPRTENVIARDVEPRIIAPWQRFWARALDSAVYSMLLLTLWTWLAGGRVPQWSSAWNSIFGVGMTVLLEPVQLRLFGTTLGKWIFGIRVTDPDGRKLGISDGIYRTWAVLWRGQGLRIPVYSLWRQWKSYCILADGGTLDWEYDSELTVKDTRTVRYFAALGAAAAVFGLSVILVLQAQLPENRGTLNMSAFCENYRKLANQEGIDSSRYILNDDGTWSAQETPGVAYMDIEANGRPLDMVFWLADDGDTASVEEQRHQEVEAVTISEILEGPQDGMIGARMSQRRLMALSMLMAQPDYSIYGGEEENILLAINGNPFESFRVSVCGLEFIYDVEYTGYWETGLGMLVEDDDPETEPYYCMSFTVMKEE